MKKLLTILISITCIIALCTSCNSNNGINILCSFYGIITDASTGNPVNNATITLAPGGKTTISGMDGIYQFDNLEEGQYTITVQAPGYQTNRKTIRAIADTKEKVDIPLTKQN